MDLECSVYEKDLNGGGKCLDHEKLYIFVES